MKSNETYMETQTKIRNSLTFEFSYFRVVARSTAVYFNKKVWVQSCVRSFETNPIDFVSLCAIAGLQILQVSPAEPQAPTYKKYVFKSEIK